MDYVTEAGFHLKEVSLSSYLGIQGWVLLHYLKLVFWPSPLVFDYGRPHLMASETALAWVIILFLLGLTLWAYRRRNPLGFCGIWFFLILAPTSLIPLSDFIVEHRMYLPLMAPVILFVVGIHRIVRSKTLRIFVLASTILVLGLLTVQRNVDYQTAVSIWKDTVSKQPRHPRAYANLGAALHAEGRLREALLAYRVSLLLDPQQPDVYSNVGYALENLGDLNGARRQYEKALQLQPGHRKAAGNLSGLIQKISSSP